MDKPTPDAVDKCNDAAAKKLRETTAASKGKDGAREVGEVARGSSRQGEPGGAAKPAGAKPDGRGGGDQLESLRGKSTAKVAPSCSGTPPPPSSSPPAPAPTTVDKADKAEKSPDSRAHHQHQQPRKHKHHQQKASTFRSSSMSKKRDSHGGGGSGGGEGGYPWDMESLKEAILSAETGKDRVKDLITKSLFVPRAPAFTALINLCGKEKMSDKALEVFETSQDLSIAKNTYMYSALISALGSSGKWQTAFEYFELMLAEKSDACRPNTITYSALISACERAGQTDKALEVFDRMIGAGIAPDLITYSVLLSACEKDNRWDKVVQVMDQMHANNMHASPLNYSRIINALGERGEVVKAVEIFQKLQICGLEISLNLCNTMLNCCERNGRGDLAYHLMRSMHDNGIIGESITYNMILSALGKSNDASIVPFMMEVYNTMKFCGIRITGYTCSVLAKACDKFNDPQTMVYLNQEFQQLGFEWDANTKTYVQARRY